MNQERRRAFTKLGEAGDRFGDYLCVDWANLSCIGGRNQNKYKIHQTYNLNFEV